MKPIVTVQTWGTFSQNGHGIFSFLASYYRRENPGHVSIELQLPVNKTHDALIEKYCSGERKIPHMVKTIINEDGSSELVHLIRFSFIASKEDAYGLNGTYREDTEYERPGHDTGDRDYLETAELVERNGSKRSILLYPACSLTEKGRSLDFNTTKGKYLLKLIEIANQEDLLKTVKIIEKKINKLESNEKIIDLHSKKNKTLLFAAQRLGIQTPQNGKITPHELGKLFNIAEIKKPINAKLQLLKHEEKQLTAVIKKVEPRAPRHIGRLMRFIDKIPNSFSTRKKIVDDFDILCSSKINLSHDFAENIKVKLRQLAKISSLEDFTAKALELKNELAEYRNYEQQKNLLKKENDYFLSHLDDYLCYGRPADGEVVLPIGDGENELNARSMLEQMREIVDSGFTYDLLTYHCSNTALSVLRAGKERNTSPVTPAKVVSVVTPQMVYNEAMALRDKVCKISPQDAITHLDRFYSTVQRSMDIRVVPRKCHNLHEAILSFAIDTIFPEGRDVRTKSFYVFSDKDKKDLVNLKNELLPTELLRDLWGIIPGRSLPLSEDGSNNVVIDKNMTFGEMVQGLSILAKNNAEMRLNIQKNSVHAAATTETDPYIALKIKIESEIERLGKRTDKNTISKTANLMNAYVNIVQELNTDVPQKTNKEKSEILFKELIPYLKVNTGFNIFEASSLKEVSKLAKELGITGTTDYIPKYRRIAEKNTLNSSDDNTEETITLKK